MHPVQLKVGLSALERAGGLEHLGNEGYRILLHKGVWNPDEIEMLSRTINNILPTARQS